MILKLSNILSIFILQFTTQERRPLLFYHCICSCHKLALIFVFLCGLSEIACWESICLYLNLCWPIPICNKSEVTLIVLKMRMSLDNYKLFKMKMKLVSHFHHPYLSMTQFHVLHKSRPLSLSLYNTLERVNLPCLPLVLLSQRRSAICSFLPLMFFLKFHSERLYPSLLSPFSNSILYLWKERRSRRICVVPYSCFTLNHLVSMKN